MAGRPQLYNGQKCLHCDNFAAARDMCWTCYQRWYRAANGNPVRARRPACEGGKRHAYVRRAGVVYCRVCSYCKKEGQ